MGIINLLSICTDLFGKEIYSGSVNDIDYMYFDTNVYLYKNFSPFYKDIEEYKNVLVNDIKTCSLGKKNIYVFDHIPPYPKVKEQLRRRLIKIIEEESIKEEFKDEFKHFSIDYFSPSFLTLTNEKYINFIRDVQDKLEIENKLNLNKSFEGEQNISYMLYDLLENSDRDLKVCVNSIDGDVLLILLFIKDKYPNHSIYFYNTKVNLYISIDKIYEKIMNNSSIEDFISKVLLFGHDFFPSINNYVLDKSVFRQIYKNFSFIKKHKATNLFYIDVDKFVILLENLKNCSRKIAFTFKSKEVQKPTIYNTRGINDFKEKFIEYIDYKYSRFDGDFNYELCEMCDEENYSDIFKWLELYLYTLNYFANKIKGLYKISYDKTYGPKINYLIEKLPSNKIMYIDFMKYNSYQMDIEEYKKNFSLLYEGKDKIKIVKPCYKVQYNIIYKSQMKISIQ